MSASQYYRARTEPEIWAKLKAVKAAELGTNSRVELDRTEVNLLLRSHEKQDSSEALKDLRERVVRAESQLKFINDVVKHHEVRLDVRNEREPVEKSLKKLIQYEAVDGQESVLCKDIYNMTVQLKAYKIAARENFTKVKLGRVPLPKENLPKYYKIIHEAGKSVKHTLGSTFLRNLDRLLKLSSWVTKRVEEPAKKPKPKPPRTYPSKPDSPKPHTIRSKYFDVVDPENADPEELFGESFDIG